MVNRAEVWRPGDLCTVLGEGTEVFRVTNDVGLQTAMLVNAAGHLHAIAREREELKMAIDRIRFVGQAALAGQLRDLRSRLDDALTAIEVVEASSPLESDG